MERHVSGLTAAGLWGLASIAVLLWTGCTCAPDNPSAEDLMAELHEHKAQVDQVVAMATEDSHLERIDHDWFMDVSREIHDRPEPQLLTAARWAEYRRLFRQLHLESGVRIEPKRIFFLRRSFGIVDAGYITGYVLLREPPGKECESLGSSPDPEDDSICYQRIEGSWYVFTHWSS